MCCTSRFLQVPAPKPRKSNRTSFPNHQIRYLMKISEKSIKNQIQKSFNVPLNENFELQSFPKISVIELVAKKISRRREVWLRSLAP